MDAREERGLVIAATSKIEQNRIDELIFSLYETPQNLLF